MYFPLTISFKPHTTSSLIDMISDMDNLRMIEDIEFQPNDEGQPSEETAKQEGLQTGDVLATRIEAIDSSKHEHPTAL